MCETKQLDRYLTVILRTRVAYTMKVILYFTKISQFRNVNILSLYRIKYYLSLFKKNVLTNFAKSFKFLKNINVFRETSAGCPQN